MSVHKRRDRQGSIVWVSRWREPDTGKNRSKAFSRKGDADRFDTQMRAARQTGTYISPDAGKITFEEYAEAWRAMQVHRESTANQVRTHLTRHLYPRLGGRPIAAIRTSEVQAMVKSLTETLAPSTIEVTFAWASTIFKAAVADRAIPTSPCAGVKLPPREHRRVTVIPPEAVGALAENIDPRYRTLIVLGAGSGVRISEALGLTVDRVDFLRGQITVDRQLVRDVGGSEPSFGPVKDRANRPRVIPVGQVVVESLAAHLAGFGAGAEGLIFTNTAGGKVSHSTWSDVWRKAADPLGISAGSGFHLLRHFYASSLIASGASVKEVQERLGHSSATMTLDIYSHLWPSDEGRTRAATDQVLGNIFGPSGSPDVPRAGYAEGKIPDQMAE